MKIFHTNYLELNTNDSRIIHEFINDKFVFN